jgi:hypothetical protein
MYQRKQQKFAGKGGGVTVEMEAEAQDGGHFRDEELADLFNLNRGGVTARRGSRASSIFFISKMISPLGEVKCPKEQKAIILPMLWKEGLFSQTALRKEMLSFMVLC